MSEKPQGDDRETGPMHTEFAHYFTTLRFTAQLRWAAAGVFAAIGIKTLALAGRLLPERHPAKAYLEGRLDITRNTLLPALSCELSPWPKRIGRGAVIAALIIMLLLVLIGAARTGHHYTHLKQERSWELVTK